MNTPHIASAEAYYKAFGNKDLAGMEKYLHPGVHFMGPLAELSGKDVVLEAARRLFGGFNALTIRAKVGAGNQVMVAYDLDCPQPIGIFRVAVLMTFTEDLISDIELFYDARPFEKRKEDIFAEASQGR